MKASRFITHRKKLKDSGDALQRFVEAIRPLGARLGPILFQLPPGWRCNPERLAQFVDLLPGDLRNASELRDPGWHTEQIAEILHARDMAFCVFEIAGLRSPCWLTASLAYLRLHGPDLAYTGSYESDALQGWARETGRWREAGANVWCFFDNGAQAWALRDALSLERLCEG